MRDRQDSAVSPVVAVILMVAVTVVLSAAVGAFVFNLGSSTTDSSSQSVGVRMTSDGPVASVEVITGETDELRLLVNGTVKDATTSVSPGTSLSAITNSDATVTVVSITEGDQYVVTTGNPISDKSSNLVAHYELESGGGQVAKDSAYVFDGDISGGTWTSSAKVGSYALTLDGTNDYVQLPTKIVNDSSTITIATWVRIADNTERDRFFDVEASSTKMLLRYVIDNNGNPHLQFHAQDKSGIGLTASKQTTVQSDTWMHLAGVVTSSGEVALYRNGVKLANATNSSFGTIPATDVEIGRYPPSDSRHMGGSLDDFRVYNRALSDSEISRLYNATK